MKTNYDRLKERNEPLSRALNVADSLVKTHPAMAAVAYGRAMEMFLSAICSDNAIAFDRIRDLTPINLIGTAYSYGIISRYEKGVLDDIRYTAYAVTQKDLAKDQIDTETLLNKIISLFGMIMRYFHLETEEYSEDCLPIGNAQIVALTKTFELDTPYDKQFLCVEGDGGFSVVAQYVEHRSDLADEVIEYLRQGNLKAHFRACRSHGVLAPCLVPHQKNNNLLCVKTHVPKGYVPFSFDEAGSLCAADRFLLVTHLCSILAALHTHKNPLSLGGFELADVWMSPRAKKCVISGMESRIGSEKATAANVQRDIQSFARLAVCLLPEYETLPVAGLLIKHMLSGQGKASMARLFSALHNQARHCSLPNQTLFDASDVPPLTRYQTLCEEHGDEERRAKEEPQQGEDLDFDEMYSKVFN